MNRKPGQIVLVGALAQGFVSRAIKYGTTLREQPGVAGFASFARWLLRFGVIAAAILYGWSLLGAVAAMVAAIVLGVIATWFIAAAFTKGGWSHAALITRVDPDGSVWVTEAVSRGVVEQRFHYGQHNYEIIDPGLDDMSLARVLEFAADVRAARETYGFAQIFGLFLYCVTGTRLCVQWAGTSICSGFVCNALDGAGPDRLHGKLRYTWPRPPFACMPSDIADFFEVGGQR